MRIQIFFKHFFKNIWIIEIKNVTLRRYQDPEESFPPKGLLRMQLFSQRNKT